MIVKIPESFGQAEADIENYLEWRHSPEGGKAYWLFSDDPRRFYRKYEICKWRKELMEPPSDVARRYFR